MNRRDLKVLFGTGGKRSIVVREDPKLAAGLKRWAGLDPSGNRILLKGTKVEPAIVSSVRARSRVRTTVKEVLS